MPAPDEGYFKRMRKKSGRQSGLMNFVTLKSKGGKLQALNEEDKGEAREAMNTVLQRSGSIGDNRTLFVDSIGAVREKANNSYGATGVQSSASFSML